MIRYYFLFFLIVLHSSFKAQKTKVFPSVNGVSLDDKNITMPFKNNKFTIIAIAFDRSAETDLKTWLNPLYDMFIKKEEKSNFDMAEIYDVNFAFVPMISGFKKIANDFKKGTEKQFWPYIIDTEKTDVKELQKQLQISDNNVPYFYVLNKNGEIICTEMGKFKDEKLDHLEDAIE